MQKIIGRQLVITVFEQNKHGTFFLHRKCKKNCCHVDFKSNSHYTELSN